MGKKAPQLTKNFEKFSLGNANLANVCAFLPLTADMLRDHRRRPFAGPQRVPSFRCTGGASHTFHTLKERFNAKWNPQTQQSQSNAWVGGREEKKRKKKKKGQAVTL